MKWGIRVDRVVYGTGEASGPRDIVVDGDRIDGVKPIPPVTNSEETAGDPDVGNSPKKLMAEGKSPRGQILHFPGCTLLPGLVDAHNHPSLSWYEKDYLLRMNDPYEKLFFRALRNLKKNVESGVTAIRCLAEKGFIDLLYRRAVDEGYILGPRMITCTRGIRPAAGYGFLGTPAQNVEQYRQLFQENVEHGADFLKFFATGSLLIDGQMPANLSRGDIEAIVAWAHKLKRPVTVHAAGGTALDDCLRAGVDCVEHGYFMTERQARWMAAEGIPLVVTSGVFFDDEALENHHDQQAKKEFIRQRPLVLESIHRAVEAGVNISAGTDGMVGRLWREVAFLRQAGMDAMESLAAVTRHGAELCGLLHEIGTIEKGKRADFVVVQGDPVADASALQRVKLVVRDGKIVFDASSRSNPIM